MKNIAKLVIVLMVCFSVASWGQGTAAPAAPKTPAAKEVAKPKPLDYVWERGHRDGQSFSARWLFDKDDLGALPKDWEMVQTGEGTPVKWQIVENAANDGAANRCIALTETKNTGNIFNLLLVKNMVAEDLCLQADIKTLGGKEDPGAGIVWRVQDKNNYYLARWNAGENNFRVYAMVDGKRKNLASANIEVDPALWHELEIKCNGNHIVAKLDKADLIDFEDTTFTKGGGVGLYAKSDSTTAFDDIRLSVSKPAKPAEASEKAQAAPATIKFPGGRIALSADGNLHDKDDFGATAIGIAMLHYAGLGDKLVHYDFSNHLGKNNPSSDAQMIESAIGGAERFKLDKTKFFNDQTQLEEAIANFKAEGNKSSADNPLWYICAGPMESAWRCINAVEPEKRPFIYCVSHSNWNDSHGDTPQMTHHWEDLGKLGAKLIHIIDQNGSNGDNDFNTPESNWLWLKESSNPDWQWLFGRNVKDTFDVSDAGMTFWLITGGPKGGNEKAGWAETRALFDPTYKYEKPKTAPQAPRPNKPAAAKSAEASKKTNAKNRIVINDPLKGSSLGKATGGKFLENGGWTVEKGGDRIIWELPAMGPNGMLELDIRNLDPLLQAKTDRINFLGLWGHLFANMETKGSKPGVPDTDGVELRMGSNSPKYKIEYHSLGVGKVVWWTPFEKYDLNHTYHMKIEWRGGVVTTWLDDVSVAFSEGCDPSDPIDHFNFLHLGTSPTFGNQAAIGPIYSNLKITEINE